MPSATCANAAKQQDSNTDCVFNARFVDTLEMIDASCSNGACVNSANPVDDKDWLFDNCQGYEPEAETPADTKHHFIGDQVHAAAQAAPETRESGVQTSGSHIGSSDGRSSISCTDVVPATALSSLPSGGTTGIGRTASNAAQPRDDGASPRTDGCSGESGALPLGDRAVLLRIATCVRKIVLLMHS